MTSIAVASRWAEQHIHTYMYSIVGGNCWFTNVPPPFQLLSASLTPNFSDIKDKLHTTQWQIISHSLHTAIHFPFIYIYMCTHTCLPAYLPTYLHTYILNYNAVYWYVFVHLQGNWGDFWALPLWIFYKIYIDTHIYTYINTIYLYVPKCFSFYCSLSMRQRYASYSFAGVGECRKQPHFRSLSLQLSPRLKLTEDNFAEIKRRREFMHFRAFASFIIEFCWCGWVQVQQTNLCMYVCMNEWTMIRWYWRRWSGNSIKRIQIYASVYCSP